MMSQCVKIFRIIFLHYDKSAYQIWTSHQFFFYFLNFTSYLINYSWNWRQNGSKFSELSFYIIMSLYTKFGFSSNFFSMFLNFTSYISTLISLIIHDNDVTMCQNFQNYLFTLWRVCILNLNFPPIFLLFFF